MVDGIVATFIDMRCPEKAHPDKWDLTGLQTDVLTQFGVQDRPQRTCAALHRAEMEEHDPRPAAADATRRRKQLVGAEVMRETERMIMLNVIDNQWKDHLLSMDHLKEGIGLRGYGQKDPLVEYKKEVLHASSRT